MYRLFKPAGLLLIFCACTLIGFTKSAGLRRRQKKLSELYRAMSDLRERIRTGAGELERLVQVSFHGIPISFANGHFTVDPAFLEPEDTALLNEFFRDIGMSDAKAECERVGLYLSLLRKNCDAAEQKCGELCRLYNTLGILCGIFLCIFLL